MTNHAQPLQETHWAFQPKAIAVAGSILGLVAFWSALPPFTVRSPLVPVLIGVLAIAAGLSFWFLAGWRAYILIVPILAAAHYFLPMQLFARGIVLPYVAPVAGAWLSSIGAATYRHFMVRGHDRP